MATLNANWIAEAILSKDFLVGAAVGALFALAIAGSSLFRSLALAAPAAGAAWLLAGHGVDMTVEYAADAWAAMRTRPDFLIGVALGVVGAFALAAALRRGH